MTPTRTLGLFPGQGSQRPGMAAWIGGHPAAAAVMRRADDILGLPLTTLCVEGSAEDLRPTDIAQPAIVATSLALMAVRRARGQLPDAVAGHSLGEFTALAVAGVLEEEAVLRLVRRRGELMARASGEVDGAMSAILGLSDDLVEKLCTTIDSGVVEIANHNQPTQTVVSGHTVAVVELEQAALRAGATRVVRLKVGGPFHCALMAPIADEFARELDHHHWHTPTLPILSAVTADYATDPAHIKALLRRQLTAPVRWVDTIRRAAVDGFDTFTELGPGQVLTGCTRRITPHLTATAIPTP